MTDNPYMAPRESTSLPTTGLPPAWMPQTYRWSRQVTIFGAVGALVFAETLFPPCGCGFAIMPRWQAASILLSWLVLGSLITVSGAVAVLAGLALWVKYGTSCPGIFLCVVGVLSVWVLSLPLFG